MDKRTAQTQPQHARPSGQQQSSLITLHSSDMIATITSSTVAERVLVLSLLPCPDSCDLWHRHLFIYRCQSIIKFILLFIISFDLRRVCITKKGSLIIKESYESSTDCLSEVFSNSCGKMTSFCSYLAKTISSRDKILTFCLTCTDRKA